MKEKNNNEQNHRKQIKRNILTLRIADNELETLNMISFEDDESISQIVRKAIKTYDAIRKNRNEYNYWLIFVLQCITFFSEKCMTMYYILKTYYNVLQNMVELVLLQNVLQCITF